MQMNKCHCSVKIKDLQIKQGGHIILNHVTLTANHGEILAIIGKNGAGKTTLLKAILHSKDYKGSINFFDSKGNSISKPKIGYVPQRLGFDRNTPITVMDFLCANSSGLPIWLSHGKKRKEKAYEILEKVDAQKYANKPMGQLSGGELQRVLLAFALEPRPDILLLDEPVSAIDRKGISRFYAIIKSMREDYHMPVILISHDLEHVIKYATSYALINHTVTETGKAQDLVNSLQIRQTFGLDIGRG